MNLPLIIILKQTNLNYTLPKLGGQAKFPYPKMKAKKMVCARNWKTNLLFCSRGWFEGFVNVYPLSRGHL